MDRHFKNVNGLWKSLSKLRSSLPSLVVESLLITFGVLLAFAIDSWKAERKMQEDTHMVLENLRNELVSNRSIVLEWLSYHDSLAVRLKEIEGTETYKPEFLGKEAMEQLYPEPTISFLLQETAWQTAHSTRVVNNFKYMTTYNLTHCYESQSEIDKTKAFLFAKQHETPQNPMSETGSMIKIMSSLIQELSSQERYLLSVYRDALIEVDKELTLREH